MQAWEGGPCFSLKFRAHLSSVALTGNDPRGSPLCCAGMGLSFLAALLLREVWGSSGFEAELCLQQRHCCLIGLCACLCNPTAALLFQQQL